MAAKPPQSLARERHTLAALVAVTSAAAVFAVLLVLVRLHWARWSRPITVPPLASTA